MATENNLQKIHIFPTQESYEQNKNSVGENDIVLIPDEGGATVTINATGGLSVSQSGNTYTIDGSGKANASHTHSTSDITSGTLPVGRGGTGNTTGLAASATKLATARTIQTNLSSTSGASFNGTANITPGITGTLAISHGGTGVTSMARADYTTNRPRGIILQSTTPSSVPNGCIVGVYE